MKWPPSDWGRNTYCNYCLNSLPEAGQIAIGQIDHGSSENQTCIYLTSASPAAAETPPIPQSSQYMKVPMVLRT